MGDPLSEYQSVRATVMQAFTTHRAQLNTRPVQCACGWEYSARPNEQEALSHIADAVTEALADLVGVRQA